MDSTHGSGTAMQITARVFYPTESWGEEISVEMEPGETPEDAIIARAFAQYEFVVVGWEALPGAAH